VTGRFELALVHVEAIRQSNRLYAQLVEHFDFEETTASPRLEAVFPKYADRLRQYLDQHDGIL